MIIDGKDLVLGRLASFVAKRLLEGEHVAVVNSEQVVVSGRKEATFDVYDVWLEVRNLTNPRKGPFHLKRPEELVRRAIRGMLPFDKPKGRAAYRCLRVYVGVPQELADKEIQTLPEASLERLGTRRFIRIGTLSKHLGARF
ncbi:50S ribosomal protein L13 [subsurface metagenome]|nr:50S ribosomal protein L13 [Hadesarchaea archaeon]